MRVLKPGENERTFEAEPHGSQFPTLVTLSNNLPPRLPFTPIKPAKNQRVLRGNGCCQSVDEDEVCPDVQSVLAGGNASMKGSNRRPTQRGFTIMQVVTTIAIISVITTFGALGIRTARAEFRLQNSARLFATYIEKARADAIRRHANSGQESTIETFGPGSITYAVSMDWGGSGVVATKTFSLESGLTFSTAAKKLSFDWRGRIAEAWVFQIFSDQLEKSLPVDVSGSGDITVGEQHFPDQLIPDVQISEVTNDVDVATPTPTIAASPSPNASPSPTATESPSPSPTNNGNGVGGNNGNGNGNSPTPSPTPDTSPTPSGSPGSSPSPPLQQCASSISPSSIKLSQSDVTNQSGSATFTMTNATGVRTISATQAGNGNAVNIALSLLRIDGNGLSVITVSTKHGAGNRGVFIVEVSASPSCGSTQLLEVSIKN
jgi:hypothetical protein